MQPARAARRRPESLRISRPPAATPVSLNLRRKLRGTPPFTTTQFHVLFNSLFKVLFNFPSRYLFAIGLGVIFSLTWSLPRTLSCTPKQLDSTVKHGQGIQPSYGPITLYGPWPQSERTWTGRNARVIALPNTTFRAAGMAGGSALGSARFIRHY